MIPINLIKKLRVNKEMTQMQVAKACGVTQGTVASWEKGTGFPKSERLATVAQVLGCDIETLLRAAVERQAEKAG
ncbi:MAG: helix-turn-helix transcriptional regulator [Oscillospiraceae bacterium]|nr:helix-turn-helix transcriptional regulator [Oscillospiraceae bacterium]